ncbi:MAG: NAD(P)-dependent oxidoreductase [Planctomycetota bacterium]
MRILITGAAGKVGSAVATHFQESGHDVVATDAIYRPGLEFKLHLIDLLDQHAIYPLVEGCDAVIQLGNHPNAAAVRPPQKLLKENVAMNTNVFYAAIDLGVRRIVGVSTVQTTTGRHGSKQWVPEYPPCSWPYLPGDAQLPRNPGNNAYALSKIFAEQTLEALTREHADLAAASVRLPAVLREKPHPRWHRDYPLRVGDRRLMEGLSYLSLSDTLTAMAAITEGIKPGYRPYFVAQSLKVNGMSDAEVADRFFPESEVRGDFDPAGGLIDLSAMRNDFGWSPAKPRMEVDLADYANPGPA